MIIIIAILGLIMGSFGSVLLTRRKDNTPKTIFSILFGRSECPKCKKTLQVQDLIPLVSFFSQQGKCRYCKTHISRFYPLIEISTAIIAVGTYLILQNHGYTTTQILIREIMMYFFLLLAIYDFKTKNLHEGIRRGAISTSIIFQLIHNPSSRKYIGTNILIFGGIMTIFYLGAKYYAKKKYKDLNEGMGIGDIYIAILIGSRLPQIYTFQNIPATIENSIQGLLVRIMISAIGGIIRYLLSKKEKLIPFIPWMIISSRILILRGKPLLYILYR